MTQLSYQALESLWTSAGGKPELAPIMAAIAIAESGGNPSSLNDNPHTGDYSVGLWQINYYGDMLADRTRAYGSPQALRASPTAQARAAVSIYNGQGLKAWTTYTSGAYKRYLQGSNYHGADPVGDTSSSSGGDGGSGGSGSDGSGGAASNAGDDCAWSLTLPVVGKTCVVSRHALNAGIGGFLMTGGVLISITGLIILAAYGFQRTGILDKAAQAASVVPGGGKVAGALATGAKGVKAKPATTAERKQRQQAKERTDRKEQLGREREDRLQRQQQQREDKTRAAQKKKGGEGS